MMTVSAGPAGHEICPRKRHILSFSELHVLSLLAMGGCTINSLKYPLNQPKIMYLHDGGGGGGGGGLMLFLLQTPKLARLISEIKSADPDLDLQKVKLRIVHQLVRARAACRETSPSTCL
ncbi:hypothetical protein K440DRAFT_359253 [Wilcoxina mikolae CBS 423.85]|nr:hypothetical protein K440DRAFT_359253 [Wilcoxina mikolae CBS 423.85]